MVKKYDPKKIESRWQKFWISKKIFSADDKSNQEKKYILIEFPYPSGTGLHMGHMRPFIAGDVVSKYWKLKGQNVMYPIGWDAFGLPAENFAIKNKLHPAVSTKKNIANAKKQLLSWGTGFDWSREINTTDPEYYRWTQWIFLQFLKKGLAYEATGLINWCPKDKTGLANEEVVDGKCERCGTAVEKKELKQWYLKITDYAEKLLDGLKHLPEWPDAVKTQQENWIGRSEGANFKFQITNSKEYIEVFTTRADTLFGVTYLVLSPENKVISNFKGQISNWDEVEAYIENTKNKTEIERTDATKEKTGVEVKGVVAINPANGEEVPIYVADYVLANYGTGAVMAVPAHDERDFEFAKKYKLATREVLIPRRIDHRNPHVPGKEVVFRKGIIGMIWNRQTEKYLCLKWKTEPWTTFVVGGIEGNEDPVEAARREIKEETGYSNLKYIKTVTGPIQSEFYAAHKNINRIAHTWSVLFELEEGSPEPISEEEKAKHEVIWLDPKEVTPERMAHAEMDLVLKGLKTELGTYTGEGIIVNSGKFDKLTSEEAREKITLKFGQKKVTYKLRDWVFSRQRYWGEPIPVMFCRTCREGQISNDKFQKFKQGIDYVVTDGVEYAVIPVPEKDLPVLLPKVKNYEPTGTGQSPLAAIEKWVKTKCPQCGGDAKRETNTMPQWAGSSWYWLRYTDSENKKEFASKTQLEGWTPVDMYFGGMEHTTLHLLYSRFWNLFLYDQGLVSAQEPFFKRIPHGLVLGPDGEKMSKSRGNTVSPDDFIKDFGADTTRLYMMFLGPHGNRVPWNSEGIIGTRRFLEKVWRLQEKLESKEQRAKSENEKIEVLLHKTIKKVGEDIEGTNFNTAISALMILVNEMEKEESVSQNNFEIVLKLLAPFAPHVAEELWAILGHKRTIYSEMWPKYDEERLVSDTVLITIQVEGKVRGRISLPQNSPEGVVKKAAEELPDVKKWLNNRVIKRIVYIPNRLINFVI